MKLGIATAFISDRGDEHLPRLKVSMARLVTGAGDVKTTIDDREHHLGLAGAVRAAWAWAVDMDCDYLFHCEEDWLFERPVNLGAMRWVLDSKPFLAQMILRRGIEYGNAHEVKAGGWVEANPSIYTEWDAGNGHYFLEHREIFSLNPCLIPRKVLELGWDNDNERGFTQVCLDLGYSFGVWGRLDDAPHITHMGQKRSAGWRP